MRTGPAAISAAARAVPREVHVPGLWDRGGRQPGAAMSSRSGPGPSSGNAGATRPAYGTERRNHGGDEREQAGRHGAGQHRCTAAAGAVRR
ncbi:hypothetical protein ABZ686_25735, partial [Streptomyces sp. NPDC006992]|uniref:hypothetical protein n=1 Tax=Streptomyces sp. NPDC006992 TaxID=3155601 RepID=UPI0033E18BC3